MPALEFHSPDPDLVDRIRQGLDRHLGIHSTPVTGTAAAPGPATAPAAQSPPPPVATAETEEEARIRQAALEAFFGRTSG